MKPQVRLLKEASRDKSLLFLSILAGLLAGILAIFQAREISRLIDRVFLHGKDLDGVSGLLITLLLILLLRAGFVWAGEFSASTAARRIKQALRQRLFAHLVDLGPAHLRGEAGETEVRTGELVNITSEGVEALEVFYSQYLPQIALAVLIPLSILFFVFPADFLSGMILLLTAPLLPIFMVLIGSMSETLTRRQWLGLSRMSAYFLDVLQGLTTLKALGRSRDQVEMVRKVSEQYRQSTMGVLKVTFLSALVLELISTLSTAVVAVEVGIRLLYGRMEFEQAFFVLLLAPEFYLPLRMLGTRFHAAMTGIEAGKRIFSILDLPTSTTPPSPENKVQSAEKPGQLLRITIKEVGYTYSNDHTALQQVSFDIPPGKITALVGESGAGKTTLTWLILGFLQPHHGEILVNGRNLSTIPKQGWLDNLAWVPQNPYLFNDTVTANIKIVRPDATEAQVLQAARLAHADEFIHMLPQGYATLVGERGSMLSAGQAQRIALARAFLKDAPLLILDEATSHLDPEVDALLQDSLANLSRERTVILIAHHQSTLARADQVIMLRQGRVENIQQRTHPAVSSMASAPIKSSSDIHPSGVHPFREMAQHSNRKTVKDPSQSTGRRLISLISPYSGRILLSVLLGFATIASGIGLMATSAYIISAAALHPSIADLQVAIVGVRFFGISRGVFRYLERLVSHDVTFRLLARWREWFYQALEPLAPARLMQYHSADLLSRVIGDIGTLESFYVRAIAPPLVATLVAIAMAGFFTTFGPGFSILLLGFLAAAGVGLPVLIHSLTRQLGSKLIDTRSRLNTVVMDGIQGLPDLLTGGRVSDHIQQVINVGDDLGEAQARYAGLSALQSALGGLLANLCMLVVLILAIQRVSQDQLMGVLIGVVVLGALTSFEAVQPLPVAAQNLEINHAAAGRLVELVDASPEVSDPLEPATLPSNSHLEIKELTFRYPTRVGFEPSGFLPEFNLNQISFSVPDGKHIAIVGPNGAGKTTLINLLQRFWEYHHGSIQLAGNEISRYVQEAVRERIAVASQGTYLFSATIKENLLIACPGASMDKLIQAAKTAHLHEKIQSLPQGYDTWIGEHGLHLSAGERQRLAIARALLRDAPILILDEPTAHLDSVTEMTVMDSIRRYSHGRSSITITQRLVGLDRMDEILVLKDGRIIEHGTHEQLMAEKGLYHQMWHLYNQIL
jgi:ATP-binding cassette subfamily C protein CydCD